MTMRSLSVIVPFRRSFEINCAHYESRIAGLVNSILLSRDSLLVNSHMRSSAVIASHPFFGIWGLRGVRCDGARELLRSDDAPEYCVDIPHSANSTFRRCTSPSSVGSTISRSLLRVKGDGASVWTLQREAFHNGICAKLRTSFLSLRLLLPNSGRLAPTCQMSNGKPPLRHRR